MRWGVMLLVGIIMTAMPATIAQTAAAKPEWKLTWSDEFDGRDGSAPDPAKWMPVVSGSGMGNNELETYTARPENIRIEHSELVITARKEHFTGPDGIARDYTSGRIQTKGHFDQKYGRFEARMRIPAGEGMWPAFWMLGSDIDRAGWPGCGEIDVMENVGKEPGTVHGTLHGPGYSGDNGLTDTTTLPGKKLSDAYHVYAAEWEPDSIRFYLDGKLYETQTPGVLPKGAKWVFDHPFFLLLNLAVGGKWPGPPDAATHFPAELRVDWVRVYAR